MAGKQTKYYNTDNKKIINYTKEVSKKINPRLEHLASKNAMTDSGVSDVKIIEEEIKCNGQIYIQENIMYREHGRDRRTK